jgi:hypothetical protein
MPSWDESGSYAQFSDDNKGISISDISDISCIFHEYFKHVFSVIGPTGAEIQPVKGWHKKTMVYELPPDLISCQSGLIGFLTQTCLMGSLTQSFQFLLPFLPPRVTEAKVKAKARVKAKNYNNKGCTFVWPPLVPPFLMPFLPPAVKYVMPLVINDLFNSCQTGLTGQTGLMGISTRSFHSSFKTSKTRNDITHSKHVKTSFKHSIEWHLKEIKEIKRPKNLITFCFHSSFKTSCVCCVFRPAAGCVRTPRRVKGGSNCFFQPFSNV